MWEGKACVGDVNLKEQWDKGRKKAEKILQDFYKHEFNFEQEFSNPQYDLLRPRGSYVGVQATPDDARSERERTTPLQRVETVLEPASVLTESAVGTENSVIQSVEHRKDTEEGTELDKSQYNDCDDDLDDSLGMDIEDFLPDTPEDIDRDVEPKTFSKSLDVNGKQVLKTSVVATLSTAFSKKLSV